MIKVFFPLRNYFHSIPHSMHDLVEAGALDASGKMGNTPTKKKSDIKFQLRVPKYGKISTTERLNSY